MCKRRTGFNQPTVTAKWSRTTTITQERTQKGTLVYTIHFYTQHFLQRNRVARMYPLVIRSDPNTESQTAEVRVRVVSVPHDTSGRERMRIPGGCSSPAKAWRRASAVAQLPHEREHTPGGREKKRQWRWTGEVRVCFFPLFQLNNFAIIFLQIDPWWQWQNSFDWFLYMGQV